MARRNAVITGTVSGIGRATTDRLVAEGWLVFATVLNQAEMDEMQTAYGEAVTPLILDVTDAASIARAAGQVDATLDGQCLDALVNNAGVVAGGDILTLSEADFDKVMGVNLKGAFLVAREAALDKASAIVTHDRRLRHLCRVRAVLLRRGSRAKKNRAGCSPLHVG